MKRITTAILAIMLVLGAVSCKKDVVGNGPISTQTRTLSSFSGIDLRMNGNVYYTRSAQQKVEISAKESIHSMLETTVVDNKLVIRYYNGKTYDNDESIRINISAPDLSSLQLNTSGSIFVLSDLHPASLFLRSSGSGDISLQTITTNSIEAESLQSGRITAGIGTTQTERLKTDGSGKINLGLISAKSASTHIKGSGDIVVKATDNLDVDIDGSGSVYFSGHPLISTHISGSGHLVRL